MIKACGLVKRYGSTMAVNGLSFSVRPGAVTGFLGPNGSGKSTTMRLVLGLDAPDARTLTGVLREAGAQVQDAAGGSLVVAGLTAQAVADIAAAHRLILHELTPQAASLEEAYMELTRDSAGYRPSMPPDPAPLPGEERTAKETRP